MKTCDLCGSSLFELVADLDRRGNSLATCLCRSCGLVCHRDIPSDAELAEYYSKEYRNDYHGEMTPGARRVDRAWRNGQRLVKQLAPHFERGGEVFEVGAGIGCNVKSFEMAGYAASGIDPGVGFAQYAQKQLLADVRVAQLFELPPQPTHDAVLLVHVIEHFNSPRAALQQIHKLLVDGGKLYVECPNLGAPFARRSKLFHYAHIHNFTPQTLAMMARRCGFHVEKMFSKANDPNLQMLLTKVDSFDTTVDHTSVRATREALRRASSVGYHLRWNYIWPRTQKLAGYLGEHLVSRYRVKKLIAKCQRRAVLPAVQPPKVDTQLPPARRAA